MAKKHLQSVQSQLSALAGNLPTQRPSLPVEAAVPEPPTTKPNFVNDPLVQTSLRLRLSLRKQLDRLASEADLTVRAFILQALKDRGLAVRDDDLLDLRKERGWG